MENDVFCIIEVSGSKTQVGLWEKGKWISFYDKAVPGSEGFFEGLHVCLDSTEKVLSSIKNFVFCEGPGSIMGIRSVAMALKTWRCIAPKPLSLNIFSYTSLAFFKAYLEKKGEENFIITTRVGKDNWVLLTTQNTIVPTSLEALAKKNEKIFCLDRTPNRQCEESPFQLEIFFEDYTIQYFPDIFLNSCFLRKVEKIDALLLKESEFVKWSGLRHKAPKK